MPILRIRHEDGREFDSAESAYKDLYEPFGFEPIGVVFGGAVEPYTEENLKAAKAYEAAGGDPNTTPFTLETAARQAADSGQKDRAAELTEQANALRKATVREPATTNPPNTDLTAGKVAAANDPGRNVEEVTPAEVHEQNEESGNEPPADTSSKAPAPKKGKEA